MTEAESNTSRNRARDRNPLTDLDISRLSAGDPTEWKSFLELSHGVVQAAGFKVGLRVEEREELTQTTCIICLQSISGLRDPGSMGAWVYRVAYRQALKIVRDRTPGIASNENSEWILERFASNTPSEDEILEQNEMALQLRQAVAGLGEPCTALLQTLYLRDRLPSYEEVSAELNMPMGSIGPTRARCLDRAKKQIENVSDEGQFATKRKRPSANEPGSAS